MFFYDNCNKFFNTYYSIFSMLNLFRGITTNGYCE